MSISDSELHAALKKYFGFSKFKGLQEDVIKSLLSKNHTFVIMPTGGGKSLCYQLPALMQEGTAIVVSPLIALMKNQVDAIRGISNENGVAHVLNSSLNKTEVKQVKEDIVNGITKLLYVAPESLTKEENVEFLRSVKISFMAIDEAHCISEWGHDFRPEYRNLRHIIKRIGENIPIIGLTATATPKVQEDIIKNLGIGDAKTFKASFNRPNLYYEVRTKTKDVDADVENDAIVGIITDGDLRRMLTKVDDFSNLTAQDIMSKNPRRIQANAMAIDALEVMESNDISQLLVEENGKYAGVVHLHDLIKEGII